MRGSGVITMAIPKPDDPHGTTAPLAWVYTDEDILRAYSDAFAAVAKTVSIQLESAEAERSQIFEGVGLWSGSAAGAAHGALNNRIIDLKARKSGLARIFRGMLPLMACR